MRFVTILAVVLLFVRATGLLSAATVQVDESRNPTPIRSDGFRFDVKPGPHAVGLKVVDQYDHSRTFQRRLDDFGKPSRESRDRPVQTLIWYPAQRSDGTPMTVGDYAQFAASETDFAHPHLSDDALQSIEAMKPALKYPLWAVRDAIADTGRFPVVIYAPSLSAGAWENADLCEYLASQGYVVLASPSVGRQGRLMTIDVDGVDTQASDISFLIGYSESLPNADASEVAVVGYSWGGISNLFAAARDSRIVALVALDGSMRAWPGIVQKAGYVHPENMTIPLLFFSRAEDPLEQREIALQGPLGALHQGPSVLNAWTHGDLMTVEMLGFVHTEFSSMFQRNENLWKSILAQRRSDYGRDDGAIGYAWVARYTEKFLDEYLKHDGSATDFLRRTPLQNGAPKHSMAVAFRAASGVPSSFDGFRSEIGRRGFDHAAEIYEDLRKGKTDFKLDDDEIYAWAEALLDRGHFTEAISLLQLNVIMYPNEAGEYENLADAYVKSGDKSSAIKNYQKCIAMNPDNQDVKDKLARMLGRSP